MKLKLGTRKSLLAWSQSQWVAQRLEALRPGLQVELVGMETQGDRIVDKPLREIEGKEFFTAELDQALLRGDTQITVHSMKDLSLERPPQFCLAAVPERELPQDVVVFHASVLERLAAGLPIRVGTSSPRRLTLMPEFLRQALPRLRDSAPALQFIEIRGNVNTRLSRVHEPEGSPRKLDAVVLAFAGLERLSLNPEAEAELQRLRQNTRLMLIPARQFPTAPAQGALAVECRADQPEVIEILHGLHHAPTERAVREERKILEEWGGGCHQKLGATFLRDVLYIAGEKPSGEPVREVRGSASDLNRDLTRIEASDVFEFKAAELMAADRAALAEARHVFFAHSRGFEFLPRDLQGAFRSNPLDQHVWVSGWKSWTKLAAQGVWVEGCLEGQGYAQLAMLRTKVLLRLQDSRFAFVSHDKSGENPDSRLFTTYTHDFREIPSKIWTSERLFWSSGLPFETIWSKLKTSPGHEEKRAQFQAKQHYCGPGKTADRLRALGFEPKVIYE